MKFTVLFHYLFIIIIFKAQYLQAEASFITLRDNKGIQFADSSKTKAAASNPRITNQPKSIKVPKTGNAKFEVTVAGETPNSYQWKKNGINIIGATKPVLNLPIVQLRDSGNYSVEISNAFGTSISDTASLRVEDNFPPNAMLISPTFGNTFSIGDTIKFIGGGNDFENGILNKSSFFWMLELHNAETSVDTVIIKTEGIKEGYFIIPKNIMKSDKAFYRLSLTVHDNDGFSDSKSVDIHPRKAKLSFITDPPGLKISVDGILKESPYYSSVIAGKAITVSGLSNQWINGIEYAFDHWMPEGLSEKNSINITITGDVLYTAIYKPVLSSANIDTVKTYSFESGETSNTEAELPIHLTSGTEIQNIYEARGTILREFWTSVRGTTVDKVPSEIPPNGKVLIQKFEGPENLMDNYGTRISGYIYPPASGTYYFWIASDEQGELWLSRDDSAEHKVKIAYVPEATYFQEWSKFPEQKSAAITLEEGKKYYIEALHKESLKIDHVSVGWQLPDGRLERPIPGEHLSPYITPYTESETIELIPSSETDSLAKIIAYPSPTDKGLITLSLLGYVEDPRIHIAVFDIKGKRIYNEKTTCDLTSARTVLPINERFKPGVYIIQVEVGKRFFFERIYIR